jgi:phage FluMu gp28-like protein
VFLSKCSRNLAELLDRLGMSPRSRAALGVDLARTVDLATAMSEKDPDMRRELLREAGLDVEAND